jgi:hypothetical protein
MKVENVNLDEIVGQWLQDKTKRITYLINIDFKTLMTRGHFEE